MKDITRILVAVLGFGSVIYIMRLLIKKKISERSSILWMLGAAGILILCLVPGILDGFAGLVGIDYPPALLFLFSTIVLFILCLYHSIQISMLNERINELTQNLSIHQEAESEIDVKAAAK